MKAAVIREHGDLNCVMIENVPEPKINADEVLLEIRAAALNHLDIWVRRGRRGGPELPKPHILGSDAAGVVVQCGPDAPGFRPGDEVILNPGLSCGHCEYCRAGEQSLCASFGIMGLTRSGTFAERIAVPSGNLWPKPAHLGFNEAAALPLAYLTAWRMLVTRGGLKPGQSVLIHGIGGGVALAALQLARLFDAQVIVTSSSDEKLARAANLGANHTINYKMAKDLAGVVRDLTNGRGVDIAIDTVGAATWATDFAAVRRGGRIVLCGITTGATAETNLQALYWNQISVLGSTMGSNEDFRQMLAAVNVAKLTPVIDSVFSLEQAKDAMNKMETGRQFGKIVLVT